MKINDTPLLTPPNALEAEQSVLGALMLDNGALDRISDLQPEHFYRQDHRLIYAEIARQIAGGKTCDVITVFEGLGANAESAGGVEYLNALAQNTPSAANIRRYADTVIDRAIKRQLITIAMEAQDLAMTAQLDAASMIDQAATRLEALAKQKMRKEPKRFSELLSGYVETIQARMEGRIKPIKTGFDDLDNRLDGGLERGTLSIVAARPGMGKCLGRGTKVVMYDGTLKKVEDVAPGDVLMGDDSTPRNVLSIGRGREQMYWIRQSKGIDYRVNESHILSLKYSRNESSRKNGDVLNIEVSDYIKKSDKFKNNCKGYKVAIDFPEVELPLHPYFLGLWLGDGDTNGARITNEDFEVLHWLSSYAETIGMKATAINYGTRATTISISKGARGGNDHYKLACVRNSLRDLGVLGNKHIPHAYIANSTENRLQLLAGLIDSDGHASNGTGYEITQTRKALAEQIKFLCDSLGFKTSITEKTTSLKSQDYVGIAYRVRIHGDVHRIPVRIERKKIAPSTRVTNWRVTGITVEPDCIDDFYGFEIDGNHLFLLEDMTVTHNTAMGLALGRNVAEWGSSLFLSMEMSAEQVADRNIAALGRLPVKWLRQPEDKTKQDREYWDAMTAAFAKADRLNMDIDDETALTMLAIRAKARATKRKCGLDLLVIDQLSFITGSKCEKSYEAVGEYTRGLVSLSKELNTAVVLLCQLNRECEKRNDKRPMLSDLASSGSIEQDAANVLFLYRDEVYSPDSRDKGICEVIIAKQRQGAPGRVGLAYIGEQTRFEDLKRSWHPEPPKVAPVRSRGFSDD